MEDLPERMEEGIPYDLLGVTGAETQLGQDCLGKKSGARLLGFEAPGRAMALSGFGAFFHGPAILGGGAVDGPKEPASPVWVGRRRPRRCPGGMSPMYGRLSSFRQTTPVDREGVPQGRAP